MFRKIVIGLFCASIVACQEDYYWETATNATYDFYWETATNATFDYYWASNATTATNTTYDYYWETARNETIDYEWVTDTTNAAAKTTDTEAETVKTTHWITSGTDWTESTAQAATATESRRRETSAYDKYAIWPASKATYEPFTENSTEATESQTSSATELVTIRKVIWKYYSMAPGSISGFDKQMVRKQKFGLTSISSELSLKSCELRGLDRMEYDYVYHESSEQDFEITQATVSFPYLIINCNMNIRQMSSKGNAEITAKAFDIPADLTLVHNSDLNLFSIKHNLLQEPKIKLASNNAEVWQFVNKYFIHELTLYLTKVMSDNLKTKVASDLKRVAKAFMMKLDSDSFEMTTVPTITTALHDTNSNQCCLNVTVDHVISMYYSMTPAYTYGFDKEIVHKQNFGLMTISSELILRDCKLSGLDTFQAEYIYHEGQVFDFQITGSAVRFPLLTIDCDVNIRQMSSSWNSLIHAEAREIPAELTIAQSQDLNVVSIQYKLLQEPRIRLTLTNRDVIGFVHKYFMQELTTYFTKVMSENLKARVASDLKRVAKALSKT